MALSLFNTTISGSGLVGLSSWIDLGIIPIGRKIWVGNTSYTSTNKLIVFELRSNTTGLGSGTTGASVLLDTASLRAGLSTTRDLYKGGRMHVATTTSTGVEHWWLRLSSKSSTAGNFLYRITYTLE